MPIKKPKTKKYSLTVERREALKEMQRYVVEREMTSNGFNFCITCGAIVDNAQGGHFISRTCRATELVEENIHPQCITCNCYKNGDPLKYRAVLMDRYGLEYVTRLENMRFAAEGSEEAMEELSEEDRRRVLYKKKASDYHEIRVKYKELRKQLKEKRGW